MSTAVVPPRESFGMWEAVISKAMTACSMEPIGTGPFHAALTPLISSDSIGTAIARNSPELARRTSLHVARSDCEQVVAILPLAGTCDVVVDDEWLPTPVGSMYIIDDCHPQMVRTGEFEGLMIRADRDLVMAAAGLDEDDFPAAVVLDPVAQGALVIDFFRRLVTIPPTESTAPALLQAGVNLLGAGMAAGCARVPGEEAARMVAREQVTAFLHNHLCNPDLDVAAIATACHLSRRTVHRAVEPWGGPMNLLRQLRVQHACELLPRRPDKTIGAIARACGFRSERHFYRAFRTEIGMSPAEFREQSLSTAIRSRQ